MGSRKHAVGKFALGLGLGTLTAWWWALAPRFSVITGRRRALDLSPSPYAHRGLHDAGSGIGSGKLNQEAEAYVNRLHELLGVISDGSDKEQAPGNSGAGSGIVLAPENSLPAFEAACRAGYGIELDVRLTRDGQVVVVHDGDMNRISDDSRSIVDLTYDDLQKIALYPQGRQVSESGRNKGCQTSAEAVASDSVRLSSSTVSPSQNPQHVPLLEEVLSLIDGRVPLIVEYKMDRGLDRELIRKTDALLSRYRGAYVIESFNPLALVWYRKNHPSVTRGQLVAPFRGRVDSWEDLLHWMAGSLLFNWVGRPDFVACEWHGGSSLPMRIYRFLGGVPIAWTIRSEGAQRNAMPDFDGFIFESYLPGN